MTRQKQDRTGTSDRPTMGVGGGLDPGGLTVSKRGRWSGGLVGSGSGGGGEWNL